ncbi:hypothetical protein HNV11_09665 [Spirosoma taeanense]|uniref:Uncharacterized protein n=1 Tax=Spirosoma taeanense TaxID=2735870 RepID=A0A6M5Y8P6_9BACT|nr:hypothetical protein [Spirosoma taeanense]QJW89630.1 hypothetical protein HNV11_09665 [Spirosoma taeanense]
MTLLNRFFSLFRPSSSPALLNSVESTNAIESPALPEPVNNQPPVYVPDLDVTLEPLPNWLTDEETLRDEGVLFGLSDAGPDEKIAAIQSYFGQQTAPLASMIELYTDEINTLEEQIEKFENQITKLRSRIDQLYDQQPATANLVRTLAGLGLSLLMCIGNFYLIDETLRPAFSNQWIAIGVFLAGMFNLFGPMSFFYEEDTRLTGRRLLAEVSLPLASAGFIFAQALQTQSVGMASALFVFVFVLFLLAGKLLLSMLTSLRNDLSLLQANRRLMGQKQQQPPVWERQIEQFHRDAAALRTQRQPILMARTLAQAKLTRLNVRRDGLVNLFLSEFELARSLRDRLTEQQRNVLMNYE